MFPLGFFGLTGLNKSTIACHTTRGSKKSTIACHMKRFPHVPTICRLTWLTWRTPFNLADLEDLPTLLARSTHACMHAFCPVPACHPDPPWIVLGTPPIASTPHLSHNCGQICDRNCDKNCDVNFGPEQLYDRIHFRIKSTFFVLLYRPRKPVYTSRFVVCVLSC